MNDQDGKCKEFGCNNPTNPKRNGGYFEYCYEHKPNKDAELVAAVGARYAIAYKYVLMNYPNAPAESQINLAMHLNNQTWKNQRTPKA